MWFVAEKCKERGPDRNVYADWIILPRERLVWSCKYYKTVFRKLVLFLSSGEGRETPTMLSPLERADFNHKTEKSRNLIILSVIHHHQHLSDSTNSFHVFPLSL
jgi:hypothetical protein